jgi:predicted nucleic acid-binding protein
MLLVDTNIWLSAADRRSELFRVCVELLESHLGDLAAPTPVIAETSWLILDRLVSDSHHDFLGLVESGLLLPIDLTRSDWSRTRSLCAQY